MLETFIGPRPPKMKERHLNDIRTDNQLENLAWGTNRQNFEDAVANGRINPKLDEDKAREVVRLRAQRLFQYQIAERLGVSQVAVHKVRCGKLWAEVTGIAPRKRNDFEGPGRAIRIKLLDFWEWTPKEIQDFLEVSDAEVYNVLTGRAWGRVTGIKKQPTRSERIDDLEPEILRLRGEGWPMRKIAKQLGVGEGTVNNVEKRRRA
jgi:DNA-binding CsgD family transcriptional regulator